MARTFGMILALGLAPRAALAISCITQAQMPAADRTVLVAAATRLAGYAASGDAAALKAATLPAVAAQFDGIAATLEAIAPALKGATLAVQNVYLLHAEDLKASDDEAQFFCSTPGSPMLVTVTIPQLPPGSYALAILHATGVAKPEQLGLILAGRGADWQLAGFFARPLTMADHDGVWYWSRARELVKARQRWSAYLYYQSAQFLLTPVDFLSSPNLSKLQREAADVRPEGLPGEDAPTATLASGDQTFTLTSIGTDGALGGLDVAVHYKAADSTADPVAARAQALALMSALVQQHAELRANFHGLWVYAETPGRRPFAVEQPMDQIH